MSLAPQSIAYKESEIPWLGKIPKHWSIVRGVFLFFNKKVLNSELQCQERLALTMSGVIERDIEKNDGLNPADFRTYQIFQQDDLVFKLIDLDNLKTSRVGYVHKIGIMSSAYIRLIPRQGVFSKYFYYQYFDLYLKHIFNFLGTGVRSTLGCDELLDIKIMFPPLQEQKAIADFLDKKTHQIEDFITKKQKLITLLEEKKQTLINQCVTQGLDSSASLKDSGVEWLGKIPTHWEVRKLKYVVSLRNKKEGESDFRIGLENIESKTGKFIQTNESVFDDEGIGFFEGDVLFGKLRPYLAKVFLADKNGICVSEFLVLRSEKVFNRFLKFLMLSGIFIDVVNSSTYGTKMPRANWEFIGNLKIPLPPLEEQKAIAEYLDTQIAKIDLAISKIKSQINLIKEYKSTLISEAVCGRVGIT